TVSNHIRQKVENFGFDGYRARCAIELTTISIQSIIFEQIEQLAPHAAVPPILTHGETAEKRRRSQGTAKLLQKLVWWRAGILGSLENERGSHVRRQSRQG